MTPFKIKRLYMENYKLFHLTEIEFENSLTIFGGPNGYGKTSVFDALELLIMGSIDRITDSSVISGTVAYSTNFLAKDAKKDIYIKGEFAAGDEHLVFAKRISPIGKSSNMNNPKKLSESTKTYKLPEYDCPVENWDDHEIGPKEVRRLLGIGSMQEFHLAYYIPQEDRLAYFNKSEEERTRFIQQLFGMTQEIEFGQQLTAARRQLDIHLNDLDKDIEQLTTSLEHCGQEQAEEATYECLFPDERIVWDQRAIAFAGRASESQYSELTKQIKGLLEFLQRKEQFLFAWPVEKFRNLSREMQQSSILAYVYLLKFGEKSLSDSVQKQQVLASLAEQMKCVAEQKFLDVDYKVLTKLFHKTTSLEHFDTLCNRAHQIRENQSALEQITSQIMKIRTTLHNASEQVNKNDGKCPYCGHKWETQVALNQQFAKTTEYLTQIFGRESTAFDNVISDLRTLFEKELKDPLIQKYHELEKDLSLQIFMRYSSPNEIKSQARLIQQLLSTVKMEGLSFEWKSTPEDCLSEAVNFVPILLEYESQISSEYFEAATVYNFDSIFDHYFHSNPNQITVSIAQVKNKLLYIQQMYYRSFDGDREKLSTLKKNREDMSALRQQLYAYEKVHSEALEAYRETVISQIEIPFFLYTSRILQSYQGGQGILIQTNGKNIRFVSPGREHDVLYTMSSGQLSAILMAFSLAINKIYSTEQFQTLLIDDPIQCMDDINMISLIEVLRSDFRDMQIVLSTHEEQFANYIAYKYEKYNLPRKYISLKDIHVDKM